MRGLIFTTALLLLAAISCGKKEEVSKKDTDSTITQNKPSNDSIAVEKDTGNLPELMWEFEDLRRDKSQRPLTNLHLLVNGEKHTIRKNIPLSISRIIKEDYWRFGIPEEAIIVCRAWLGKSGEDFWVIKKDNELVIMNRKVSEPSTANKAPIGEAKEIKKIRLK